MSRHARGARWLPRTSAGFGLLEMLFSVTVLAVGLLAIAALHVRIASLSALDRARVDAQVALLMAIESDLVFTRRNGSGHSYAAIDADAEVARAVDGRGGDLHIERSVRRFAWSDEVAGFQPQPDLRAPAVAGDLKLIELTAVWSTPANAQESLRVWALAGASTSSDAALALAGGPPAPVQDPRAIDMARIRAAALP